MSSLELNAPFAAVTPHVVEDGVMSLPSRRAFLQTAGAGAPALAARLSSAPEDPAAGKFTPLDLSPLFTAASADWGPQEPARRLGKASAQDQLVRTPGGRTALRGIPFLLGPEDVRRKSWLCLSRRSVPWKTTGVEIPVGAVARYLVLAHFCDWYEKEFFSAGEESVDLVGELLANASLVYEDGKRHAAPIRRRFETNAPTAAFGQLAYAARPHRKDEPSRLSDPLSHGTLWGNLQTGVWDRSYGGGDGNGIVWLWALENPHPETRIRALRLEAESDGLLFLCGITLYHGRHHPLQYSRLQLYRFTQPEGASTTPEDWDVDVDLGLVARKYALPEFSPDAWLACPDPRLNPAPAPAAGGRLYAEISATPEATIMLRERSTGQRALFDLSRLAGAAGSRVELIYPHKTWLHGKVIDRATGRPTPVRLAFRSLEGRYLPPYGHRYEVNTGWFQDYGADVVAAGAPFAYVDGSFQVELPVGEVLVEIAKGYEYGVKRQRLKIAPGQRELTLEVARQFDLRSKGWMTADVHVHFLSPSTAVLEGQAEGLNYINLLAAQWGDLFTNVGDLPQGALSSPDGETTVWVGTENRQHFLGHLALMRRQGEPVFPMSASGPSESYIGDPMWASLNDWCEENRSRGGLNIAVHYPHPTSELAAAIALGKVDAAEIYLFNDDFTTMRIRDWYRALNCGYRLPCVGGTDKMSAGMPVGAGRTYAYIGTSQMSFDAWAAAVRAGRTFTTTGPLLQFHAEGRMPGSSITIGGGGATITCHAEVFSYIPIHRVEVVFNGKVVASREAVPAARQLTLNEAVHISGPGWLAARCLGRLGPFAGVRLGIQAHTSPVYVAMSGREHFVPEAGAYMLKLIDGARTWVDTLAIHAGPERAERLRRVLAEARAELEARRARHSG